MGSAQETWDLVVIGGGSAGIVAAQTAASLGASVLLIEKGRMGGDCLWTGCVPSKSLIAAASVASDARRAAELGITVPGISVDFRAVMDHIRATISTIEPVDSAETLNKAGVKVIHGTARFTAPSLLGVDGHSIRFRQALLTMGAEPAIPPIPGLPDVPYLTSDSIWDMKHLPDRLVILGAGSVGCELGQAFARLGSNVTFIDGADNILPREDPHAAGLVARSLRSDGATLLTGRPVSRIVATAAGGGEVIIGAGSDEGGVAFDQLLVAVGRTPRTMNLGLERVGVELDQRGFVKVSRAMRTTNKRIWAAGDLTDHPQFTHTAGVNGSLAASNAILGLRRKADTKAVPRVTFTDPEVAAVGLSTSNPVSPSVSILTHAHDAIDRAITEKQIHGFTRLAIDRKGTILGGTVVGPRAGETITEVTLAIRHELRTKDIASTIHPYPTFSDGIWLAAIDDVRRRLQHPTTTRVIALRRKLRRATIRN